MRFTKTDDPVKGIGFVAIYFANLEDTLDELVKLSGNLFTLPEKIDRWKFRDRVEWLQKQFRSAFASYPYPYSVEESTRTEKVLVRCRTVAVKRNEIVHQPIFGSTNGDTRKKAVSGKMSQLDCGKIYRFAEEVATLDGALWGLRFQLKKLWDARQTVKMGGVARR